MKGLLCEICLKGEVLCKECSKKNLSRDALEILRYLHSLSKKASSLEQVEIEDIITSENSVIIVAKEGDAKKIVGRKGNIVKKLSSITTKEVRVIERSGNFEKIAENLILPAKIKRINTLFLPSKEIKRVFISNESKILMPYAEKEFKDIMRKASGKEVEIIYE